MWLSCYEKNRWIGKQIWVTPNKAEKLYLTSTSFSTSNFYGLPKTHKSKQINGDIPQQNNEYKEIRKPDDLTVRPIVGGPNCATKPLSQLIDIILKLFSYKKIC